MRLLSLLVFLSLLTACHPPASPETSAPEQSAPAQTPGQTPQETVEYAWMPASDAQKFLEIEEQFQGYSRTMREVHYRYNELYFAGQDENWAYADYQLEHIVESIEQGNTRRPARGANAKTFLDNEVPALQEAIDAKNAELFAERFEVFTGGCNSCHGLEEHGFIRVRPPTVRFTAIGLD